MMSLKSTLGAAALSATTLLVPMPIQAQDGAYIEPPATGQVIATFYYSNSESGFDADGDRVDIPDYRKLELYVLAEYTVTDEVTLVFTPSVRDIAVEGPDNDASGLGYTDLGLRYRFAETQNSSLAIQATARIPGEGRDDLRAQVVSTDPEYDFRLRGFHGFTLDGDSGFLDLQGSYRFRAGAPPNEFHTDVTIGYRPVPSLLLMAQSFNTISDGRGDLQSYRFHNVQLSAVKQIANGVSLQLGWISTVAGKNALRERGAFGGVWISF